MEAIRAFPIRSHPAGNIQSGGRELVDLARLGVQAADYVRFPFGKPHPSIPGDIYPVSARVLLGLEVGEECHRR